MCISHLLNVFCYHDNYVIKGDFSSFEYFYLLIIPNTPMWILKLKTPTVPYNNKKQIKS